MSFWDEWEKEEDDFDFDWVPRRSPIVSRTQMSRWKWGGSSSFTSQRSLDRAHIRGNAFSQTMQKTVRLLGLPTVTVSVEAPTKDMTEDRKTEGAGGWTDMTTIWLNGRARPYRDSLLWGWTNSALMAAIGVVYHEAGHMMYSPALDGSLAYLAKNDGCFIALNILEDHRAESRFVHRYRPSRHYFTRSNLLHMEHSLQEHPEIEKIQYPILAGRYFMPNWVIKHFRDKYVNQHDLAEIDQIISEYLEMNTIPDGNSKRAHKLAHRFYELLVDAQKQAKASLGDATHTNHGDDPGGTDSRGSNAKRDQARKGSSGDNSLDKAAQQRMQRGEGDETAQSLEVRDTTDDDLETEDGQIERTSQIGAKQKHKGVTAGRTSKARKVVASPAMQVIRRAVQDVELEVSKDVAIKMRSIKAQELQYSVIKKNQHNRYHGTFSEYVAPSELKTEAKRLTTMLRRARDQYKPGWETRKNRGKIDPNSLTRLVEGQVDVFRRWRPGVHNAAAMEIITLVDQSGSMSGNIEQACQVNWVLHHAFHNLGASYTALGFSNYDDAQVLINRGEKPSPKVHVYGAGGGTNIGPALTEAYRIFTVSNKPTKILFVVTDGGLGDRQQAQDIFSMDEFDALVFFVGLEYEQRHMADLLKASGKEHLLGGSKSLESATQLADYVGKSAIKIMNYKYGRK